MIADFFVHHEYPLQTIVILASSGLLLGYLFEKMRLPHISGQLLAGILLGPAVLGMLGANALYHVELLSQLVLGIMTFTVGTHLNRNMLHNSWSRIAHLALAESLLAFFAVWFTLSLLPAAGPMARLLAAIAMATAPGTVISLIQRKKARGVLIKTLIPIVALNNVLAILFFEFFKLEAELTISGHADLLNWISLAGKALLPVSGSILTGLLTGFIFSSLIRRFHSSSQLFVAGTILVLLNLTIAHDVPGMSGLLVNLAAGVWIGNHSYHTKRMLSTFDHVNAFLYPVFFTLAGTHLDLGYLKTAGLMALLFAGSRAAAKIAAVNLMARFKHYPSQIGSYLGLCLIPQAGLAIGLVISMGADPAFQHSELLVAMTTVVLASVAINELIGPFTTAFSFDRSHETGQANPRLIDFLHEEFILMPMQAANKWEAIRQLCEFMVKTHQYKRMSAEELYNLAVAREQECTTGLGKRMALPHIRLPFKGENLLGVIGILKEPLDFESLDDEPVRIVILLMTPLGKENQHIKVFSSIGKIFTTDPLFQERLINAHSPAEAYDLLQSKEVREINYFLEEVG